MNKKLVYERIPKNGKNGKTNLTPYKKKKGIYWIYEGDKLVYIGFTGYNLYATIIHHFNQWNDSEQYRRISYKNRLDKHKYYFKVKLMPNTSRSNIEYEEYKLIDKFKPRDNKVDYLCNFTGGECMSKVEFAQAKLKEQKKRKSKKVAKKKGTIKKRTSKKKAKKEEKEDTGLKAFLDLF